MAFASDAIFSFAQVDTETSDSQHPYENRWNRNAQDHGMILRRWLHVVPSVVVVLIIVDVAGVRLEALVPFLQGAALLPVRGFTAVFPILAVPWLGTGEVLFILARDQTPFAQHGRHEQQKGCTKNIHPQHFDLLGMCIKQCRLGQF